VVEEEPEAVVEEEPEAVVEEEPEGAERISEKTAAESPSGAE
jgi:hypothetical protein